MFLRALGVDYVRVDGGDGVRQVSARIQQVDARGRSQQTDAGTEKSENRRCVDELQISVPISRYMSNMCASSRPELVL